MTAIIKQLLAAWNAEKNQRLKMQRAYFMLALFLAVTSGLVTLVSASIGRALIMIAALLALVYLVNAVSWTIFDMIIARKIDQAARTSEKKR